MPRTYQAVFLALLPLVGHSSYVITSSSRLSTTLPDMKENLHQHIPLRKSLNRKSDYYCLYRGYRLCNSWRHERIRGGFESARRSFVGKCLEARKVYLAKKKKKKKETGVELAPGYEKVL